MQQAIRAVKPPYNMIVDITTNPDYPEYLGIRIYENQVMSLSEEKQLTVMEYLHQVRLVIESFGVKCFFDGAAGDPPRSTSV
jgi:hypothetical protein